MERELTKDEERFFQYNAKREFLNPNIDKSMLENILGMSKDYCGILKETKPVKIYQHFKTQDQIRFDKFNEEWEKKKSILDRFSQSMVNVTNESFKPKETNIIRLGLKDGSQFISAYDVCNEHVVCVDLFKVLQALDRPYGILLLIYEVNELIRNNGYYIHSESSICFHTIDSYNKKNKTITMSNGDVYGVCDKYSCSVKNLKLDSNE